MEALFCENSLVSAGVRSNIKGFHEDLLPEWRIARQKANALLKEQKTECSDDLKRVLQAKGSFFLQLDHGWARQSTCEGGRDLVETLVPEESKTLDVLRLLMHAVGGEQALFPPPGVRCRTGLTCQSEGPRDRMHLHRLASLPRERHLCILGLGELLGLAPIIFGVLADVHPPPRLRLALLVMGVALTIEPTLEFIGWACDVCPICEPCPLYTYPPHILTHTLAPLTHRESGHV